MSVQLGIVDSGTYTSSISFFRRTPRKLPKVEPPPSSQQPKNRTGWLRWPFQHRLEPLRENQMNQSNAARLKPINNPDSAVNHGAKRIEEGIEEGIMNVVPVVTLDHVMTHKTKVKNNNDVVKRRPPRPSSGHSRNRDSGHNNNHVSNKCIEKSRKRLSYPPSDNMGLHEYIHRLHMNDTSSESRLSRLSHEFSTSCPALYNPKHNDRLHELSHHRKHDSRRHKVPPSHNSKMHHSGHEKVKPNKHHQKDNGGEFLSEHQQQIKVYKNHHVKTKVKKTRSYPNRETTASSATRPQRPKPPSWQDQHTPSVTVTEPPDKDLSLLPNSVPNTITHEAQPPAAAAASVYPESILAPTSIIDGVGDARSVNNARRVSGLSRAHLKRTRSRVIDAREIPEEERVIPLSRTQQHEFHLKETHQDNEIYLTENARRCRKWLADLDVEDLLNDDGGFTSPSSGSGDGSNETITLDLEVSHERWNYLGSPYPSDIDSDAD